MTWDFEKPKTSIGGILGGFYSPNITGNLEGVKDYLNSKDKAKEELLTSDEKDAILNYDNLKILKDIHLKKIDELLSKIEVLEANKIPDDLPVDWRRRLRIFEEWKDTFKADDAKQIKDKLTDLKKRLKTAIENLTEEQEKVKKLGEENADLKTKTGNPLENIIEQKLREVIMGEEWNYPYLLESLRKFMEWRNSENKERRVAIYKYWKTVVKNVKYLEGRLNSSLLEY